MAGLEAAARAAAAEARPSRGSDETVRRGVGGCTRGASAVAHEMTRIDPSGCRSSRERLGRGRARSRRRIACASLSAAR